MAGSRSSRMRSILLRNRFLIDQFHPAGYRFIIWELLVFCMISREASALDLFTDSVRLMGDATLCGVMEFTARIDPGRLGDAAYACLRAHPVLHSRLERGNGPARWVMDENPERQDIQIETCPEQYHPRVAGPVDPYSNRQVRVRLLRRPSGDVIVVNLAHAAADGFGISVFMAQLLQEYLDPGSIPPASGGIPERDTLWTRALAGPGVLPPGEITDAFWPDPFGKADGPVTFHRECIAPPLLEKIRLHARSCGGTTNDAVMAAYFLALSDLTGERGPLAIYFPVNLRRHLNDGSRVMSNQAANVSFTIARTADEGMSGILPRVIRETRRLKEGGIGIAEQAAMDAGSDPEGRAIQDMTERMAALQNRGLADIFISNPGPFTLPDPGGLSDAYICYPGGFMPTTCFTISTFRGRMTVTMGYQDGERTRAGTQKAMGLFLHHLLSLADRPALNL